MTETAVGRLRLCGELAFLALSILSLPGTALAAPPAPYIPMGEEADAPTGFVQMCQREPTLCSTSAPPDVATPEKKQRHMLAFVNGDVNGSVLQRTDYDLFGTDERWQRPGKRAGAAGDCEDLALEKRERLIERGFPPSDLFFAVVYRREFGLHTVLVARTDRGDYVLDSLTGRLAPWQEAPYSWLRVPKPGDPHIWYRVARS